MSSHFYVDSLTVITCGLDHFHTLHLTLLQKLFTEGVFQRFCSLLMGLH